MGKVNKTYSLDEKNVEELKKEENASKLIDQLLTEHYFGTASDKELEIRETLKRIDFEIEELSTKKSNLLSKLSGILEKKERIKKTMQGVPKKILEDFQMYPGMTEQVLKNRYLNMYKGLISWEKLVEFWKTFQESNKDLEGSDEKN